MAALDFNLPDLVDSTFAAWGPPAEEASMFGLRAHLMNRPTHAVRITDMRDERETEKAKASKANAFQTVANEARADALRARKEPSTFRGNTYERGAAGRGRGGRGRGRGAPYFQVPLHTTGPLIAQDRAILDRVPLLELATQSPIVEIPSGVELAATGRARLYNTALNSVAPQSTMSLPDVSVPHVRPAIKDDPAFRELVRELLTWKIPIVAGTEQLVAAIMASPRSRYQWQVEVERLGGQIVLLSDAEDPKTREQLATPWVDENVERSRSSGEVNSIDHFLQVGAESAKVNNAFTYGVAGTKSLLDYRGAKANKWGKDNTQTLYRYRVFRVKSKNGAGEYAVVVRCEIDAAEPIADKKGEQNLIRAFALLEQSSAAALNPWRKAILQGRSSLLMQEHRNNDFKVTRWILQSLLSGADLMKIAFVTRELSTKNEKHIILGVESLKPIQLATQLHVRWDNAWSVFDRVVSMFLAPTDGGSFDTATIVHVDGCMSLYAADEAAESSEEDSSDEDDSSEEESD